MNHALHDFIARFERNPSDQWFKAAMSYYNPEIAPPDADPALLLQILHQNLEAAIYVPTEESIRIAKWIYEIARGFIGYRFQSLDRYVDVAMAQDSELQSYCEPELIQIYLIDGLPGYGKSALARALRRVLPAPTELTAEGDPPQRVPTVPALWVKVNKSFTMNGYVRDALHALGVETRGTGKTFAPQARLLFKTLYRMGAACTVVDELQFASGRASVHQALGHLLAMRDFGLPIFAFLNTDFVIQAMESAGQVAQRVAFMKQTIRPISRTSPEFAEVLGAQLSLFPFGHDIDISRHAVDIYDMVAGSQRGTARLIEVAAEQVIRARRPLRVLDLVEARRSSAFEVFNDHTALLSTLHPVDPAKHPEFSSNNDIFDPAEQIRRQIDDNRMTDAAAVALYASYSRSEREAANAAAIQIMRQAGKVPDNIAAVGEGKRRRGFRKSLEHEIATSYAAEHLSKSIVPLKLDNKKGGDKP